MSTDRKRWITTFWAQATQLAGLPESLGWYSMGVSAEDAAAWANLGFTPDEAAELIADGITPQTYGEVEDLAQELAGGPESLVTERVAELIESGTLIDPDALVVIQDPEDPRRQIIAPREDLDGC